MRTAVVFIIFILIASINAQTLSFKQTDWYLGSGRLISYYTFDSRYFRAESLNTENHNVVFHARSVTYTDWDTVTLLSSGAIESHSKFHYGDFDGDGDIDFAMGVGGKGIYVAQNFGDTTFDTTRICSFTFSDSGRFCAVYCGDFDGDGDEDIFFSGYNGCGVCWGSGHATSGWSCETLFVGRMFASDGEVADIDDDGYDDVIGPAFLIVSNPRPSILWGPDLDDTTYLASSSINMSTVRARVFDFDNDTDLDIALLFVRYPNSKLTILENEADSFTSFFNYTYMSLYHYMDGLGVADYDEDGYIDVIVGVERLLGYTVPNLGGFYWFRNDSGSSFNSLSLIHYVDDYTDGADVADYDLNGYVDIMGGWADVGYVAQTSSGTFTDVEIVDEPGNQVHFGRTLDFESNCGNVTCDFYYTVGRNYYRLLKNDMITFPTYGYLESSILAFHRGKKLRSFYWYDCVPDGFEIRYYVRCGYTVDECTTATWTQVPYSGADLDTIVDSHCDLYFQYRIEFYRTTGDDNLSAVVDSVIMVLQDDTGATVIDSVWFSEETDCDSVNIVEICYSFHTCDDLGHTVTGVFMSDSADTYELELRTLIDTTGEYGDSVTPGQHCFQWVLSTDAPGVEDSDWIFRLTIDSTETMVAGVLDSRPPRIVIDSLVSSYLAQDTIEITFDIEDMFYSGDSGFAIISYCGRVDTIDVYDTIFSWVVPPDTCDSALVVVSMRDSFCNWGTDTAVIPITPCEPDSAWFICAPCNSFASCDTQWFIMQIADAQGSDIDTMRVYFTLRVRHTTGFPITFHIHEPTAMLRFECAPSGCDTVTAYIFYFPYDGDSITITLDSLYDSRGCVTK